MSNLIPTVRALVNRSPQRRISFGVAIVCLALCAIATLPPASPIPGSGPGVAWARSGCGHTGGSPANLSLKYMRRGLRRLVNAARSRNGLPALKSSPKLRRSANRHSAEMVNGDYFSHDGPGGSSPGARIARTGYFAGADFYGWGENIAAGTGKLGSPKAIVRAWMGSSGHRTVILASGFREMGVGVSRGHPLNGSANSATYTLDVGYRSR